MRNNNIKAYFINGFSNLISYSFQANIVRLIGLSELYYNSKLFGVMKDSYPESAIKFGMRAFSLGSDYKFNRVLATRLLRLKMYDELINVEKEIIKSFPDDDIAISRIIEFGDGDFKEHLLRLAHDNDIDGINKIIESIGINDPNIWQDVISDSYLRTISNSFRPSSLNSDYQRTDRLYKSSFMLLKNDYPHIACMFGDKVKLPSRTFSNYLSNCYFRCGNISKSISVQNSENEKTKFRKSILDLSRKKGIDYQYAIDATKNKTKKVVYILHNSLPYFSGGYATRSNGVIGGIRDNGWDIEAISRLGFPNDTPKGPATGEVDYIDGIKYSLLIDDEFNVYSTPISEYLKEYGSRLADFYSDSPPAIFHGASFFMNGIAAVYAARKLGVKSVYELRGLQELSKISRHPYWNRSEHYQYYEMLETQAALDSDAVFAITQALKDEFVRRGVPEEKITVLPNGVHSDKFVPKDKDQSLLQHNGLTTETIIGFAGSFVDYEGLDILVEAVRVLTLRGIHNFKLILVGDGTYIGEVKSLVDRYNLDRYVIFTGRVPHKDVENYYSIFDICPLPRKGLPVCEMISPLKPFEAMAMAKTVVSSDVAALAEIIQDGVTGLLHEKDNPIDLADKLELLINNPELNTRLGSAARDWVVEERDWKVIAKRVDYVYKELLDN